MDLSEFLLARIADDEAIARAASAGPWEWVQDELVSAAKELREWRAAPNVYDPTAIVVGISKVPVATVIQVGGDARDQGVSVSAEDQRHIARWDPARVLAECEAKRRIVEEHRTIRAAYPGTTIETDPCCETCSAGGEYPGGFPCATLRLLALPYAAHSDYQREWKL